MTQQPTLLERAYQLAQSGGYASVSEIRRRLGKEGYVQLAAYFEGAAIRKALKRMIADARAEPCGQGTPTHGGLFLSRGEEVIAMTKDQSNPPAGPNTQGADAAHSGGTYGQEDFSKSAQRSRARKDGQSDGLKEDRSAKGGPLKSGGAS